MRRAFVVVRVLLVTAIVAPGLVATASPCLACDCVARTPKQIVKDADAAFVGTVVSSRPVGDTETVQTFDVEATYGGVLPARIDVVAEIGSGGGSSCALLFPEGDPVAVAVSANPDGTYSTSTCSYLTVPQLRKAGGPAMAPVPVAPTATPTARVEPPTERMSPLAVAVVGLLVGLALIGMWLLIAVSRARRRRPAEVPWIDEPDDASSNVAGDPPLR